MSKKSLATSPLKILIVTVATTATVSEDTVYMMGSSGAITITVPAPTADGVQLTFIAATAQAHIISFTGSVLQNGVTANRLTAQLDNVAGAGISVVSYGANWYLVSDVASPTYG